MSGFTKGPWTIDSANCSAHSFCGIHGGDDDGYIIADLCNDGYSREVQEANARLIAASPDLLAVAQKCEALLTRQKWCETGDDPEAVLLREARAAIAKATHIPADESSAS